MASHLKRVLLTALLSLVVLMGDVKPVLAKKGDKDKQLAKMLEESVRELKEKMKEQEDKVKEQDEKMKEQEKKIKTLEECKGTYTHHQNMRKHNSVWHGLGNVGTPALDLNVKMTLTLVLFILQPVQR